MNREADRIAAEGTKATMRDAERGEAFASEAGSAAAVLEEIVKAVTPFLRLICGKGDHRLRGRCGIVVAEGKNQRLLVLFDDGSLAQWEEATERFVAMTPSEAAIARWNPGLVAESILDELLVQQEGRSRAAAKARAEARRFRAVADLLAGPAYSGG